MRQRPFLFLLLICFTFCDRKKLSESESIKLKNITNNVLLPISLDDNNSLGSAYDLMRENKLNHNINKAIFYANKLISEAKKAHDINAEAWGYYGKALIYDQDLNLHDSALFNYYNSLQLRKEINDNVRTVNDCYLGMADAYYSLQFSDKAILYYDLLLENTKQSGDKANEAAAYRGLGLTYDRLKQDYVTAALYFTRSLEIQKELRNDEKIAEAYHSLAGTYYMRKDLNQASTHYLKALEYRIKTENQSLANTYFDLGLVSMDLKNDASAKAYFEKSLTISEHIAYKHVAISSHEGLALIAQLQKNYPTAIKELTIAQQLAEQDKSGNITLLADITDTFSKLYEEMGDDSKAMDYVHKKEAWQNIAKAEREQITKLLEKQRFDTVKWEDTIEKKKEEGISIWWYIISAIVISFVIGGGSVLTWTYITTKTGRAPVKKEEEKQESTSEYKEEGIDQIKPGNSIQVVETVNEDGEDDTDPIKALMNRLYRILLHQFHTNEWIEKESMQVYTEAKEMEKVYKSKPDASLYRNELKDIRYIIRNSKWFLVCLKEQDKTKKKLD